MTPIFRRVTWIGGGVALWIGTMALAGLVVSERVPVKLSTAKTILSSGDDYVLAEGTWVLDHDRQAFPLQTTQIRCERRAARCTGGTATVMAGNILSTDVTFYPIVAWANQRVVFTDTTPLCVDYVYTIDIASQSANAVRTLKSDAPAAQCKSVDPEMRMSMQEGWLVGQRLEEEAMPWFGRLALWPFSLFR